MEFYSPPLSQKIVIFESASDVVRFSYFAQRSIFHLDLCLSQNMIVSNRLRNRETSLMRDSNYFVNTKAKCQMYFILHRRFLQTLHLEVPTLRKCNVMNDSEEVFFVSCPTFPQNIIFCTDVLYCLRLSNFIKEAMKNEKKKLKILEWIVKITSSTTSLLNSLPIETVNIFVNCFYPTITDHGLFRNFVMQMDLLKWIVTYENPEIVEFLLYHASHFGRMDLKVKFSVDGVIDLCIFNHVLSNIGPIMMFTNSILFNASNRFRYFWDITFSRQNFEDAIEEAQIRISERRIFRILQLIWIWTDSYENQTNEKSLEALRLIWCGMSDPYINREEIIIFRSVFSAEELSDICNFYSRAVDKFSEHPEPRSLQQFCRLVIRRILWLNNNWIPEAIAQMNLPNKIKSFLNLEKVITTDEEEQI